MKAVFSRIRRVAFGGHTHLPGVFLPEGRFVPQSRINGAFSVATGRFFINVGSVGQPRDQNPQACYVVYDGESVKFRRVRYDFQTTARKISKIKDLPLTLGTRLSLGV
jgi:diadenosine tetraphosphatase ApaH/serine/threonine PP2A family protein phosphatase